MRYRKESDVVEKPEQHRKARLPAEAREKEHRGPARQEDPRVRKDPNAKNNLRKLKGDPNVDEE